MKNFLRIAFGVGFLIAGAVPALADYQFYDAAKHLLTTKSGTVNGAVLNQFQPVDATGMAFGTSGNPFFVSGGSSGGGAVFGPTAAGSPAANPPVLVGGTADGSGTGVISPWKVLSGVGFINCANCSGSGISVSFAGPIGTVGTPGGFKDGSGNFQPLLGDVTNGQWVAIKSSISIGVTGTFWQTTQPISAASLPLPTGAATQTTLSSILTALGSPMQNSGGSVGISGTLPSFASVQHFICDSGCSGGGGTSSNFSSAFPAAGTAIGVSNGTNMVPLLLGQALAAASIPVVLTAAQITTLTPPAAITNFALETGGNLATIATDIGAPGSTACTSDTASCSLNQQNQRVAQRLTTINTTLGTPFQAGGSIGNTSFAATQATASNLNATVVGTGTFATQVSGWAGGTLGAMANYGTSPGAVLVPGVNAFITNTVPVTLTSTTITGTVAVTQSGSWSLAANQSVNVAQINGVTPLMGNGVTGTGSQRVTIASDNTAFSINAIQSGTWNLTNISGTISLPTGAATSANQILTQAPIAPNTATATKSDLIGGQFDTTQKTLTNGQQAAYSMSARGALFVAVGADGFAVTNAGTFAVQATLNATPSLVNGNGVVPTQGGSVLSATNGMFDNLLQGNAVLSATNGLFANVLQGNAVLSQTNPSFAAITDGTNKAAVKAASTAPVATDPALVATISPNGNQVVPVPSAAAAAGISPSTTAALAANQTIKGSAGNLYSFEVAADATLSAAPWWVMIFDATSAPADGSVTPKKCYAVAAGQTTFGTGWNVPVAFATGITISASSTGCYTKTASTHAFISGEAQ